MGGPISDQPASRRSWNACWPYTTMCCTVKTVSGFSLAYAPSPGQYREPHECLLSILLRIWI